MSEDFINKVVDAALAEKIRNATSSEEIRELCRQAGIRSGALVMDEAGFVSERENFSAPKPEPQSELRSDELLRRVVTLPNGTSRLLEAYSVTGLDILERAFRKNQI